jgi:hypothetical protein
MRNLVLAIAVCMVLCCTLGPTGAASLGRDRALWSTVDPAFRLLSKNVMRVAHRGGRVFVPGPFRASLAVGIAF